VTRKSFALTLLLAVGLIAAGAIFGHKWLRDANLLPQIGGSPEHVLRTLPALRLPDPQGKEFDDSALQGKVVVVNFWATWCLPCREEIPMFSAFQNEHAAGGVQFVGVAIDEPEAVRGFVGTQEIGYPVLIGGVDSIELSRRLGNRLQGLPFTAIFDRKGNLVYSQTGPMTRSLLADRLAPLL